MTPIPLAFVLLALAAAEAPAQQARDEAELSEAISAHELKAHVYRLASPEFHGRRGAGAARAARHLAEHFRRLGLQPAFGDLYFQPIPYLLADKDKQPESFIGRNVGVVLPGSDPKLKDEWILLSAHFDHLGGTPERYYPGADDNASGVATLLEVAEYFALRKVKPRRTVAFVAFDQEENGLLGSTHFAAKPPRDLKQLKAFLTADMLGRSMGNLMDEYVFALGCESAPQLRKLLEDVPPRDRELKFCRLGTDIIGTRSDYGPFRDRKVPFLFFSSGQHTDYHKVTDRPDKIDYVKLRRAGTWVADLTARLADTDDPPVWADDQSRPDLDEVKTVLLLVTRALERPEALPLKPNQRETILGVQKRCREIVARGVVTAAERTWLVWTSRILMVSVF